MEKSSTINISPLVGVLIGLIIGAIISGIVVVSNMGGASSSANLYSNNSSTTTLQDSQNQLLTKKDAEIANLKVQIDTNNVEITSLKSQLTKEIQSQPSTNVKQTDPIVAIEKCKVQADNFARYNAQQALNVGIKDAQARGDYQTASMYMTEDPKIVATYTPDYQAEYTRCLNSI